MSSQIQPSATMQLYINEYGQKLTVKEGNLCSTLPDGSETSIAPDEVSAVWLMPGTSLSTQAIQTCLDYHIPLWITDTYGKATGKLWSLQPGSISTIRRHQAYFCRSTKGGQWCKSIIAQRINQQKQLLLFLKVPQTHQAIQQIDQLLAMVAQLPNLPDKQLISSLMGYEGTAARIYFAQIGQLLPSSFQFDKRSRQPAKDPFNALLNYFLGILYPMVFNAMMQAGLDPYMGILHADEYNRATGTYDFMELYRTWAEAAAISAIRKGIVLASEFYNDPQGGTLLIKEARPKSSAYFLAFLDEVKNKGGRRLSRKAHIKADCHDFAQYLLHDFEIPENYYINHEDT